MMIKILVLLATISAVWAGFHFRLGSHYAPSQNDLPSELSHPTTKASAGEISERIAKLRGRLAEAQLRLKELLQQKKSLQERISTGSVSKSTSVSESMIREKTEEYERLQMQLRSRSGFSGNPQAQWSPEGARDLMALNKEIAEKERQIHELKLSKKQTHHRRRSGKRDHSTQSAEEVDPVIEQSLKAIRLELNGLYERRKGLKDSLGVVSKRMKDVDPREREQIKALRKGLIERINALRTELRNLKNPKSEPDSMSGIQQEIEAIDQRIRALQELIETLDRELKEL